MIEAKCEPGHPLVVFCIGTTCSGKSTLIENFTRRSNNIGSVEVGKEMRRRYSPSAFKGLAALDETEDEVWEIYQQQFDDNLKGGKKIILIDGQPRMSSQVMICLNHAKLHECSSFFMWIHCSVAETRRRALDRFSDNDEALELAMMRLTNDRTQLFDVIHRLVSLKENIICHTDQLFEEVVALADG